MMIWSKEESLLQVLKNNFREDGMRGFYKGFSQQHVYSA